MTSITATTTIKEVMRLKKQLQVQINEELYDWVKTHTSQHNVSVSQLLRELLKKLKATQDRKERKTRQLAISKDQLTLFEID